MRAPDDCAHVGHRPGKCLGRPSRIQPMVRSDESTAVVRQSILSRLAGRTPGKRSDHERECGRIKVKARAIVLGSVLVLLFSFVTTTVRAADQAAVDEATK